MVASFPHDVRKTKPSNKKLVKDVAVLLYSLPAASAIPPWRGFFLAAAGQTRLWSSSAKRGPSPGAPAQELALTKLMISPGVPGLPNKVRKSGVGCVGWVTPGPRGGACICEADERAWGPRTGVSAHKADDLARGPRLFERSENMWGGSAGADPALSAMAFSVSFGFLNKNPFANLHLGGLNT